MRLIVTGVKDGKACVISETDCTSPAAESGVMTPMIDLDAGNLPPRPHGRADFLDLGLSSGQMSWKRVHFPPNLEVAFHHTDTIDLHTILSGSVELLLDDGAHTLAFGDSAVVAGVDHGWRAGPEGCTSSLILLGTPAREQGGDPE